MSKDDFFRNGLPPPAYCLSERSPSLDELFEAHASRQCEPFGLVSGEMDSLDNEIARALGSDHPMLQRLASLLFDAAGKRVRPTLVFLMSQALLAGTKPLTPAQRAHEEALSAAAAAAADPNSSSASSFLPPQPIDVQLDSCSAEASLSASASASSTASLTSPGASPFFPPPNPEDAPYQLSQSYQAYDSAWMSRRRDGITEAQRRLAEITEMVHTASLLHDDVIDEALTRRGAPSANSVFGNKVAVLGGDFLLARASVSLARLRHPIVVELISTVIEHLVKGEIMQLKPSWTCATNNSSMRSSAAEVRAAEEACDRPRVRGFSALTPDSSSATPSSLAFRADLVHYLTKSYYKTASLLANSCRSAALLGAHDARAQALAYEFGKQLGLCFQVVDDLLDARASAAAAAASSSLTSSAAAAVLQQLGKPANDLESGATTAPLLFALRAFPDEALPILSRRGRAVGDADTMRSLVAKSRAIEQTQRLAEECAEAALAALLQLQPSKAQSALVQLVHKVLTRQK
jgi:hexaprenyl-diphosphate synthase